MRPEGIDEMVIGTLSSGQGHETSFAQLLDEWLGMRPDCVRLVTGDTRPRGDRRRLAFGTLAAPRQLTAHQASDEIIEKGRRIASHLLEAAEAGIDFADGYFTVAGTDRSLDLFAVAVAARDDASLPAELRGPLAGIGEVTTPGRLVPTRLSCQRSGDRPGHRGRRDRPLHRR